MHKEKATSSISSSPAETSQGFQDVGGTVRLEEYLKGEQTATSQVTADERKKNLFEFFDLITNKAYELLATDTKTQCVDMLVVGGGTTNG